MQFVETTVFTKRLGALGLEPQLKPLQQELLANPEAGALEPGTGGLRKVRMRDPSRGEGKRGGARVHYLFLRHQERIYLLYVYAKNESDKLSDAQKKELRAVVEAIKREA